MNETTTLIGEVTVTVTDAAGRRMRRSRHRNRVFLAGRTHIAECLVGLISDQRHFIEVGADPAATDDDDLQALLEPLATIEVEEPVAAGDELTFTAKFISDRTVSVGESGLKFEFTRDDQPEVRLLYNRAVIDPPVELKVNDTLSVFWRVAFEWIAQA